MGNLQIIAVGGEHDRIIRVIKKYPPEKIILLTSDLEETKKEAENLAKLTSSLIDTEIIEISYRELDKSLEQLKNVIEKNKEKYDKIYANISGGTRIVSIALVLLSQYYPINVLYAVPKIHTKEGPYKTKGVLRIIELPVLNLRSVIKLSKSEKALIDLISLEPLSFSQLIKKYAINKKINLNDLKMRDLKSRFSYTLKKLAEKNIIQKQVKNRNLFVSLTNTGKFMLSLQEK